MTIDQWPLTFWKSTTDIDQNVSGASTSFSHNANVLFIKVIKGNLQPFVDHKTKNFSKAQSDANPLSAFFLHAKETWKASKSY